MSKIGKKPIIIPEGVEVSIADKAVTVKGKMGEQQIMLHPKVRLELLDKQLRLSVPHPEDRRQKALWGTFRSLLSNAVIGASQGFNRRLLISGVGYRAAVSGDKLVLNVGYSHPVELAIPAGLEVKVEKNTIAISGAQKQVVGQFAAVVRATRKPEPYKGKGIKYEDEVVRRKAGKVVKAVGGGA